MIIYTIGHSNQPMESFLELLRLHEIKVLVDVRSAPYSRFARQFSKQPLQEALKKEGIRYLYLGNELGGIPDDDRYYDDEGYVRYDLLTQSVPFRTGIQRLTDGAPHFRMALMCAEEDPARCHRHFLISPVLSDLGFEIRHIRGDSSVITEHELRRQEKADRPDRTQQSLFDDDAITTWKSPRPVRGRGKSAE